MRFIDLLISINDESFKNLVFPPELLMEVMHTKTGKCNVNSYSAYIGVSGEYLILNENLLIKNTEEITHIVYLSNDSYTVSEFRSLYEKNVLFSKEILFFNLITFRIQESDTPLPLFIIDIENSENKAFDIFSINYLAYAWEEYISSNRLETIINLRRDIKKVYSDIDL